MSLLTDKQKEELQKLADEVLKEAKLVKEDYENNPSDISGSMVNIHENSPFLDAPNAGEIFNDEGCLTYKACQDYFYKNHFGVCTVDVGYSGIPLNNCLQYIFSIFTPRKVFT